MTHLPPSVAALRDALVHERHGVISTLHSFVTPAESGHMHLYVAMPSRARYFRHNSRHNVIEGNTGSGVGYDVATAAMSAMAECVERYAAAIYRDDDIVRGCQRDLPNAVPLDDFICFSDEQYAQDGFPFARLDPDREIGWVAMRDLYTGAERLLPAQTVIMGPHLRNRAENILQGVSTGLACHSDFSRAIAGGLLEMIERDAFAATWLLDAPVPLLEIDDETRQKIDPRVMAQLDGQGPLKISLRALPSEFGVPVILSVIESVGEGFFVLGAACRFKIEHAIEKAVLESMHGFSSGRATREQNPTYLLPSEVTSSEHHMQLYLNPAYRDQARVLLDHDGIRQACEWRDGPATTDALVARLYEAGFHAYLRELTTPDIAALGLRVARVLVPGLQPLIFGQALYAGARRRLDQHCAHRGLDPRRPINTALHPFP